MKVVILLLTIITFSCAHQLTADQAFVEFVSTYNKTFTSEVELAFRKAIFADNWTKVQELKNSNSDQFSDLGMTPFLDLTPSEFKQKYLTLKLKDDEEMKPQCDFKPKLDDVKLVDAHDWRSVEGVVSDIKDQGMCGSCWAFSAVGALEGRYRLVNNESKLFSEQLLVDCSKQNAGCNGGLMDLAFQDLEKLKAIEENNYPYRGSQGKCREGSLEGSVIVEGCRAPETEDEDEIAKMLLKYGPLAIALDANWLQFYWGGVHDPWFCHGDLNHGVTLVGYGEEKGGKKYWIVKNSWGSWWGESGYFRIRRGTGACGINKFIVTAVLNGETD